MRQAGLSDDVIEATRSRDLERLEGVLAPELGAEPTLYMVITEPPA
jgi:hypothetical protein